MTPSKLQAHGHITMHDERQTLSVWIGNGLVDPVPLSSIPNAHFTFLTMRVFWCDRVMATMNPGGDFGKRELSPALRSRFTEVSFCS